MHEAAADALVRQMREYVPGPTRPRPIYSDLTPQSRRFFRTVARRLIADDCSGAQSAEAASRLLREGVGLLAARERLMAAIIDLFVK